MSLFGLFERRDNVQNPLVPITSASLLNLLGGTLVEAGVSVTPETSLEMAAVYRAVSLVSSVSASLPMRVYKAGTFEQTTSSILANPHPDLTQYELWRLSYAQRCLWGNSYMQKVFDNVGRLKWLYPIHAANVKVGKTKPIAENPSGKVFQITTETGQVVLTPREVLHIPGFGYDGICGVSPIRLAAQAIGTDIAGGRYQGKLFGSGNLLSGILQTDQRLKNEDAQKLQERWRAKMSGLDKAHEVAVLDAGIKFQQLTMPSTDAQLLETRRFSVLEIGRFYGVPPFLMLETEKSTSWGTGLEQQATGFVTFDLHPQWLAPTEQRVAKELTGSQVDVKYDLDVLLRGDSAARAAFYNVMRQLGAFNADEIRARESLPPVPDGSGEKYLQPVNMQPLSAPSPASDGANGGT